MKNAKIINGVVKQIQPIQYETVVTVEQVIADGVITVEQVTEEQKINVVGFIEVEDNVICEMVDNGDGTFSNPTPTQAELDAKVYQAKWDEYDLYQSTLTVVAESTNKYDVSKNGLTQIIAKRDSVTDIETFLWVESWDSFQSNKVELQEVILEANRKLQVKIDALFGAV